VRDQNPHRTGGSVPAPDALRPAATVPRRSRRSREPNVAGRTDQRQNQDERQRDESPGAGLAAAGE
jgi:hypothetical protein